MAVVIGVATTLRTVIADATTIVSIKAKT